MPRNLRLTVGILSLNVRDCAVKLLSYTYTHNEFDVHLHVNNQMSVTCHVTGLFKAVFIWQIFLAHNTTTMLFLPAGTSKGTPFPICTHLHVL